MSPLSIFIGRRPDSGCLELNVSESKFDPGPAPQSGTIRVEEVGQELQITLEGIDSEGKPRRLNYRVRKDGKEYLVTGPEGPGTTT